MGLSRRDFFKYSGAGIAAGMAGGLSARKARAAEKLRTEGSGKSFTVCPYCSVGCGLVVETKNGEVVNIEGDSQHPINQGALCPKGASIIQLRNNPKRWTKPMYRAKGAADWKEVEWDWAMGEIAKRMKTTRDTAYEAVNAKGEVVNRTLSMASFGSAALDNEECYLLQKLMRGLGIVQIEHQARL